MTGSHEVRGSSPLSSTKKNQPVTPFQGPYGSHAGALFKSAAEPRAQPIGRFSQLTLLLTTRPMRGAYRIVLALLILIVDGAVFYLPLTALFLAYILIWNPAWFRDFLNSLEKNDGP